MRESMEKDTSTRGRTHALPM